jgi:hypothetical protein
MTRLKDAHASFPLESVTVNKPVTLSPNLLRQINNFLKENKQAGFDSKKDFIEDAIRFRLASLRKWILED